MKTSIGLHGYYFFKGFGFYLYDSENDKFIALESDGADKAGITEYNWADSDIHGFEYVCESLKDLVDIINNIKKEKSEPEHIKYIKENY